MNNKIKIEFSTIIKNVFYIKMIKNNQLLCNLKILHNDTDKNYYTVLKNNIIKNRNLINLCKLIKNKIY